MMDCPPWPVGIFVNDVNVYLERSKTETTRKVSPSELPKRNDQVIRKCKTNVRHSHPARRKLESPSSKERHRRSEFTRRNKLRKAFLELEPFLGKVPRRSPRVLLEGALQCIQELEETHQRLTKETLELSLVNSSLNERLMELEALSSSGLPTETTDGHKNGNSENTDQAIKEQGVEENAKVIIGPTSGGLCGTVDKEAVCGEEGSGNAEMCNHEDEISTPIPCLLCSQIFDSADQLKEHLISHVMDIPGCQALGTNTEVKPICTQVGTEKMTGVPSTTGSTSTGGSTHHSGHESLLQGQARKIDKCAQVGTGEIKNLDDVVHSSKMSNLKHVGDEIPGSAEPLTSDVISEGDASSYSISPVNMLKESLETQKWLSCRICKKAMRNHNLLLNHMKLYHHEKVCLQKNDHMSSSSCPTKHRRRIKN